jgi:hypothetical protein
MRVIYFSRLIFTLTATLALACSLGCGTLTATPAGSSPFASISTSSVIFGSITSGSSGSAQDVTLSNTGSGTLNISSIAMSGTNANSFSESNNCPTTLGAGSTCTITTNFSPGVAGSYTAAISITTNASPAIQTITLSGSAPPLIA